MQARSEMNTDSVERCMILMNDAHHEQGGGREGEGRAASGGETSSSARDIDMYGVNCDDDEYCRVGLDFGGRGWQVWG